MRLCGIHVRSMSHYITKLILCVMSLKVVLLHFLPILPGANELMDGGTHLHFLGGGALTYIDGVGTFKMATILQTTFSNTISGMKMIDFQLKINWILFFRVQLTISPHWFIGWAHSQNDPCYWLSHWYIQCSHFALVRDLPILQLVSHSPSSPHTSS